MTKTLDHYNEKASRYIEVNHHLEAPRREALAFLDQVKARNPDVEHPFILDAGSGSGRDTLAFLSAGAKVAAFDGSAILAAESSRLTGQDTMVMRFEDLDLPSQAYDGIWAMASLLHVSRSDLPSVFVKLGQSLKPDGLLYAAFKHGASDRVDPDGRAFTDLDENTLSQLIESIEGYSLVSTDTQAPPPGQTGRHAWFSCVLSRTGPELKLRSRPRPRP